MVRWLLGSLVASTALAAAAPGLEAMGRAPRLELRAASVERSYALGEPIAFRLELRNRGNAPQTILAIDDEMLRRPAPWVGLEFVVSRRADGAGFRVLPARHESSRDAREVAPLRTLEPRGSASLRVSWADGGGWHWLHERDRAQLQLAGTYVIQSDVLSGCFDRPGLYDVRAIANVNLPESEVDREQRARLGSPWEGRLVSVPFTITVLSRR